MIIKKMTKEQVEEYKAKNSAKAKKSAKAEIIDEFEYYARNESKRAERMWFADMLSAKNEAPLITELRKVYILQRCKERA